MCSVRILSDTSKQNEGARKKKDEGRSGCQGQPPLFFKQRERDLIFLSPLFQKILTLLLIAFSHLHYNNNPIGIQMETQEALHPTTQGPSPLACGPQLHARRLCRPNPFAVLIRRRHRTLQPTVPCLLAEPSSPPRSEHRKWRGCCCGVGTGACV